MESTAPQNLAEPKERSSLYVKTFGCQMNEYDSEKVIQLLSESHRTVSDVNEADLVFVNTCSVREKGEHKLFSLLGSLRDLKAERPDLIIGVGGCVAQQEGEAIAKRMPVVDFVVGTHNLSLIPSLVESVKAGRGIQVAIDYREDWEHLPELGPDADTSVFGAPRALIAIQRGCNKRCSFCVVPTTRGPEVSRNPQEIIREAKLKARLGSKEIVLLGQTVNSYGRDLSPRFPFEELIREIAAIEGIERIRFTSPHPQEVRDGFLDLYRDVPQLCPHIHLPLQSGSDRVLKLMNRNYRRARYLEIVESVRERCPSIAVTTDFIVGFPTETEEDFQATMEMLDLVRYHSVFSFKYSVRPNTAAFLDFSAEQEVPESVSHERLLILQAKQEEISREINARLLGERVEILVESRRERVSSNSFYGRIPQNTPVELTAENTKPGDIVVANVYRTTPYGLRASMSVRSQ